jgi:hypothetical protein
MATTICWKGTHNEDWPAWAAFHREMAAYEAGRGSRATAAKHEEIAQKYDRRALRAAKKTAKAVTP